jgi:hypothetical protein
MGLAGDICEFGAALAAFFRTAITARQLPGEAIALTARS